MTDHGGKRSGAGRKAGRPSKKTLLCKELAEELGINPFETMLLVSANRWEDLGYDSPTTEIRLKDGSVAEVDRISVGDRIAASQHACKYLFPQRKSLELTDKDGNNPFKSFADLMKELVDQSAKS